MKLLQRFNAWRERRYWERRHLDFVRQMVQGDYRWLAENSVADAIAERYLKALRSDWFRQEHEPVERFRERVRAITAEREYAIRRDAAPSKCPITGRPYFMTLDHPDLGAVPTYGGPFDSYTIPTAEGKPTQPWHERELVCEHYDHDHGSWMDPGTIPLRIIHDDVREAPAMATLGLLAAVAFDDNRDVSVMFDTSRQAHRFVEWLKPFVDPDSTVPDGVPEPVTATQQGGNSDGQ